MKKELRTDGTKGTEGTEIRKSTIPLRKFLKDGVDRNAFGNVSYVLEYGERGRFRERSENTFRELSDIFSNFLSVWAGILDTSFGLKFDFREKNDPFAGRMFFEELKADWDKLVDRIREVNFEKSFLIGEDRLVCELIYLIFYLNHYATERGCEIAGDVSRMLNELLIALSNFPEKLSGLMRHYRNSKMFSQRAYEDVLRRLRKVSKQAYSHHSAECIEIAKKFAYRDFPGVFAFEPLMKIASNKQTIERVLRITKTDVISDLKMSRDGAEWKIDVFVEEDGVRWGALTVLLILFNDSGIGKDAGKSSKSASRKLLESMLSGDYSFTVEMFFCPEKRKFLSYLNGSFVRDFEIDVISKFVEDFSEYIYPAVETLTDSFLNAFERDIHSIPECSLDYDYVVDAVRIRVRKRLATHLEYTCLITRPVRGYYLHFIVLDFSSDNCNPDTCNQDKKRRVFCLLCREKEGEIARPKDAFYMFDGVTLVKIFEVLRTGKRQFRLRNISFEELKQTSERAVEVERKLARLKLKDFGIVV